MIQRRMWSNLAMPEPRGTRFSELPKPPEWHTRAGCPSTDPELWFPDEGASSRAAKRVCATCPVSTECLADALSQTRNPDGVWGGTTQHERRALRGEDRKAS